MPVVPITQRQPTTGRSVGLQPPSAMPDEPWALMAAAQMHSEGRLVQPMDITSQAQKADLQTKANTWPKGTSPEVRSTFDRLLKDGSISKDQYLKAMRDPRQFQEDQ